MQKLKKLKISVLGAPKVGKSTLLDTISIEEKQNEFNDSIGLKIFRSNMLIDKFDYAIYFWEFKGVEPFKFNNLEHFQGTHGTIIMFDLSRPETLQKAKEYLNLIQFKIDINIPFIFVANKLDLIDDFEEYIDRRTLINYVENRSGIYIECSKQDQENLRIALKIMLKAINKDVDYILA